MRQVLSVISMTLCLFLLAAPARAQSGIQWGGNAQVAVDRAREMHVPVMFWVTESSDIGDGDDLKDAQRDAFRDPAVLELTERYFVPCRVTRNSRMLAIAEQLGLPTNFGLYIAIITPDGKVLDQIDPGKVAQPEELAQRLAAASHSYRDSVYKDTLQKVLTDFKSTKAQVREALTVIWQMRIYSADTDVVNLLMRGDVKPEERSRLYQMLAALGTKASVSALLDAARTDKAALPALLRAEPAALPTLADAMPVEDGVVEPRQIAAYRATAAITGMQAMKPDSFWQSAQPEDRKKELDRALAAAHTVYGAWQAREGQWR